MSEHLERLFYINGEGYWEDTLKRSDDNTLYRLNGSLFTQKQLEEMSSQWNLYYNIGGLRYTKSQLKNALKHMDESPESTTIMYGVSRTREQIERALSLSETPTPTISSPNVTSQPQDSTQEPSGSPSETTKEAPLNGNTNTPPAPEGEEEDEEEDELVTKVIANLHRKLQAVTRRKKLATEVEKLRKVLAEKEVDLMECDRIMALEVEQVEVD